jgi:hypothetical protein
MKIIIKKTLNFKSKNKKKFKKKINYFNKNICLR